MPSLPGFCGPWGAGHVQSANAEDFYDLVLAVSESSGAKTQFQLINRPGSKIFKSLPKQIGRGNFTSNPNTTAERHFAVYGDTLYEVAADGTTTARGAVGSDNLPVTWAFNGVQLLVCSAGTMYVLTLAGNAFAAIADPAGVAVIGFCKTFGLALVKGSRTVRFSGVNDFTSWNGLDFISVSDFADVIVSMGVDHNQIMLRGAKKSEMYYADGSSSVFVPVPGSGMIEMGTAAQYGGCVLDTTQFWWGQDENGGAMAFKLSGYQNLRISKEFVEKRVSEYTQWTDAECFAFQLQGFTFFVSRFPSANNGQGETLVYEVKTGSWGKWSYFFNGARLAYRGRSHAYAFGKHLVSDPSSENLYEVNFPKLNGTVWDFADDAGAPIRRTRRAPQAGSGRAQWDLWSRLEFVLDTGLGPTPPLVGSELPNMITMASPNGAKWDITVFDSGALRADPSVLNGAAQIIILKDNGNPATVAWQINIGNTGIFQPPTAVAFSSAYPAFYRMVAQGGSKAFQWTVLASGIMQQLDLGNIARGPQVMVRLSKDNGNTWSNEFSLDAGKAGEYSRRAFRNRLGRAWGLKGLIVEASMSDAVPTRIADVVLD